MPHPLFLFCLCPHPSLSLASLFPSPSLLLHPRGNLTLKPKRASPPASTTYSSFSCWLPWPSCSSCLLSSFFPCMHVPCLLILLQVSSLPNPPGVLLPGQVFAVGGLRDASGNLLLPGDSFVEPLSGKTVRLLGASQQAGQTVPHAGGSQALLDANVLMAQRQVTVVLRHWQETPGSRAQGLLESAVKDMRQALALSLHHILQQARRLERQLEAARVIEASGGRIGMCRSAKALKWLHVSVALGTKQDLSGLAKIRDPVRTKLCRWLWHAFLFCSPNNTVESYACL